MSRAVVVLRFAPDFGSSADDPLHECSQCGEPIAAWQEFQCAAESEDTGPCAAYLCGGDACFTEHVAACHLHAEREDIQDSDESLGLTQTKDGY